MPGTQGWVLYLTDILTSKVTMKRTLIILLCAGTLAISTGASLQAAQASQPGNDNKVSYDTATAIVQLYGEPLSTFTQTRPLRGQKIDFNSPGVKSRRARLALIRNAFKTWLHDNARAAKVTGEYDLALNAVSVELNGTSLAAIQACPLVRGADYQFLYHPSTEDPDLSIIHAMEAWEAGGGPTNAGAEVKVAIIDTGIDINHPCFNDAGYPKQTQLGDKRFTNNKVIAAKVFNNHAGVAGYTPEAIQEHGTHVAGTVACNYNTPAVVNGVAIPHGISGVAPRALLGNYNIFPANVAGARSEDILNALETAYEDGFDIANMSLGGIGPSGRLGIQDLVTVAINNLDMANMVVAVAAGNSGPGHFTVESPGTAARALTAGASTVPHYIGAPVTVNGSTFGALPGEFATVTNDLTAPLGVVTNASGGVGLGCEALPAGSLTGKIALISRGSCSFSTKIRFAQEAGAVAALIVNNAVGDPAGMASDGTPGQPTIPAYMLARDDGLSLVGSDGASVTIGATMAYFVSTNADIMGSFSGVGPTFVDFRIKPDVVAPGVSVLSSIPVADCGGDPCWAFFQGTSMATPHLAGSAAVVHWMHPGWSAAQIRSAIVNTADKGVLKNYVTGAAELDFNVTGAGRENLLSAVNASVALDPVSVSFGGVPSGSGQTKRFNIRVNNISGQAADFTTAVGTGAGGVTYSVSPASVHLAAGAGTIITVTMAADKGAAVGGHQATLTISSSGSTVAHAAVFTLVQ